MKVFGFFALLVLVAIMVPNAESCSCMQSDQKTLYDGASNVVAVKLEKQIKTDHFSREFLATVTAVLKNNDKISAGQSIVLSAWPTCDHFLSYDEESVISGRIVDGKFKIDMCGLSVPRRYFDPTSTFKRFAPKRLHQ